MDAGLIARLAHGLTLLEVTRLTAVANAALLVYDYCLTLSDELSYIWPSKSLFAKLVYLLSRYPPFVDTFILIYLTHTVHDHSQCSPGFQAIAWLTHSGISISEIILMLRTYAIWDRKKPVVFVLVITFLATQIITIIYLNSFLAGLQYVPPPIPGLPGCFVNATSQSRKVFVTYITIVAGETIIVILTLIKAAQHFRGARTARFISRLYQDGLFYYFYCLGISLANMLVVLEAPPELANFLATTQRVLHSILSTRVLLHIREAYAKEQDRACAEADMSTIYQCTTGKDEVLSISAKRGDIEELRYYPVQECLRRPP